MRLASINISAREYRSYNNKQAAREHALELYNQYSGQSIYNEDRQIHIEFIGDCGRKLSYGGSLYYKKIAILNHLPEIIRQMVYTNFGPPKSTDKQHVIGFLNFKIRLKIDGKTEILRINIQLRNGGKFYYNHEVNKV